MIEGLGVTLVIPAHNEEEGLPRVLGSVPEGVDEVIVVDNCSADRTAEVARSLGARVVSEPRKGYGSAYMAGLAAASTDVIATADADGTYPVQMIPELVRLLVSSDLDFISARRIPDDHARNLNNILRFAGNAVLTLCTMLLFLRRISDSQSGMWVFRRAILPGLELTSLGMPFSEELKVEVWRNGRIRCREVGIPFSYSNRVGAPKLRLWRDGFRNLLFLFAKRFGIRMTGA
jgi:glycosyltransferase involved in cell wall biosynthesis